MSHHLSGEQHADSHGSPRPPGILTLALAVVAAFVVIALAVTWPTGDRPTMRTGGTFETARVTSVSLQPCGEGLQCVDAQLRITSGPEDGQQETLTYTAGDLSDPGLRAGDAIRVVRYLAGDQVLYSFADMDRRTLVWVLGAVFAIIVVAVGRLRGLAALGGLVVTYALLVLYLLPALVTGASPVPSAVLCAAAIVFVVLPLAHGWSARTAAAMLGTLGGLGACMLLTLLATHFARITGRADEGIHMLQGIGAQVTVAGLLSAGAIIGSVGVLNDVTITQASAVAEVSQSNPTGHPTGWYRAGMRVGRDHIASTVYTLVLAYAGSALPSLVLLSVSGQSFGLAITSDEIVAEVVRSWVGAVGLILAVPLTTFIAAVLARREIADEYRPLDLSEGGV